MTIRRNIRILFLILLVSLFTTFSSFAKEGMLPGASSETGQVYKYLNADDSFAINEWKQVWNNWYYFGEDGKSKQNAWENIDDKWYYFDQWSVMLHDTTTPDGYTVGSDGAWVKDGQVVVEAVANN